MLWISRAYSFIVVVDGKIQKEKEEGEGERRPDKYELFLFVSRIHLEKKT